MAGIVFKKGALVGSLAVVSSDDGRGIRGGQVIVYPVYRLALVDNQGRILTGHRFRTNAHRKAAAALIADGWQLIEEDQNHG